VVLSTMVVRGVKSGSLSLANPMMKILE